MGHLHAIAHFCVVVASAYSLTACRKTVVSTVKDADPSRDIAPQGSDQGATDNSSTSALEGWNDLLKQNESLYAQCSGQGGDPRQLSPAFLESMGSCQERDASPAQELATLAGDGSKDSKGDCQFARGISCHIHSSMEFVFSNRLRDDARAIGELHCIVPSRDPNRPTVYGAHVRCVAPSQQKAAQLKECPNDLLKVFAKGSCQQGYRCCNEGTLTKPVALQSAAETLLHPNFRICQDEYIEVDCGIFHGMHEHTANVKGLGETYKGSFHPSLAH